MYVDDIPAPQDCLYGAFVYSSKPLAHVKGITFKSSLASKKVVAVISAKDIPKGGQNIGAGWIFASEPLFANSLAEFAGQPLGVVVLKSLQYFFKNLCLISPFNSTKPHNGYLFL